MKRILCVEDHLDTCELIAVLLKDEKVVPACSQSAALKQATKKVFDLYLLDYHLPDGTGVEVCIFIRTFDKHTPILFCTSDETLTEAQAQTIGAQGIIRKGPHFSDALVAAAS